MKYKILKTLAVMVFVAGFMMVLKSCKKVDNTTLNQANKPTKEQLLAKLKLEIEKNPEIRQTIIPINQKVEGHWEDLKGNIITSLPSRTLSSTNHAARVYECASAEDVSYPPGATLTTIGVDYDCTSGGYFYTLTYNVSIHFEKTLFCFLQSVFQSFLTVFVYQIPLKTQKFQLNI